ncbi:hypothetical protein BIW11_08518 [Tropilaelaps mercedesae]|uniref:Golgin subfamily A member 4-like n=1 Tax=Tropilaelaps mercedesae TaxID=418985 RepID=A0A1V9XP51_9ACAR|nr:hypothetical protein BIW11_08518 [Tropilaelaps mercedesae]
MAPLKKLRKLLRRNASTIRSLADSGGYYNYAYHYCDDTGSSSGTVAAPDAAESSRDAGNAGDDSLTGDISLSEPKGSEQSEKVSAAVGHSRFRQRTLSSSSQSSEPAVLPIYNSPDRPRYVPQSDTESEAEAPVMVDLSRVTKEEIYSVLQRSKQKSERYKNKYNEVVRAYRTLSEEKDKIQKVLTDSQDKSLRRMNELREQADLEQKAKAHLEENLRLIIDEKDEKIKVQQTKIDLLSNSEEVVKPFKEQVRQLNLDLQSKEADVIMAKELRSQAEKELAKVKAALVDKDRQIQDLQRLDDKRVVVAADEGEKNNQAAKLEKLRELLDGKDRELQELRTKCRAMTEQSKTAAASQICNGERTIGDDHAKILSAENWEAKMRASEKKLSQKENELRKIARKMHQLKLMVITEEAEEEESISASDEGLARRIEGSVDQLLNEKHQLQKTIDDLTRRCMKHDDDMRILRNQLEAAESAAQDRQKSIMSSLSEITRERDSLRILLEEELNRANLLAQQAAKADRIVEDFAKERSKLEEKLQLSETRVTELTTRSDELTEEISALETKVNIALAEGEAKAKCAFDLEKQLELVSRERSVLEKQLSKSAEQGNNNFVQDVIHLNSANERRATGDSLDETIKENELLLRQLADFEARCKTLSEKLENFSALNESMTENTDDMKEVDAKLARAEKTFAVLEARANEIATAKELLANEVEELRSELDTVQLALSRQQAEITELTKKIENLNDENKELRVVKATEDSASKALRQECSDLRATLEQMEAALHSTKSSAEAEWNRLSQERTSDVEKLMGQVVALEATLATEREESSRLHSDNEVLRSEADKHRNNWTQEMEVAQAKIAHLEAQVAESRSESIKASEAKSILEKELKMKLSKKEEEVEAAILRWDKAVKVKNTLETRLLEQESDFETERGRLNQEIRSLAVEVDRLNAQLKDSLDGALQKELQSQEAEFAELRAKAQAATEDAEQMRRAVEVKSQELIKVVDELANRERLQKEADSRTLKLEAQYAERIRVVEAKHLEAEELLRDTAKERDVFKENGDRLDKMYRQLEGQLKQVGRESGVPGLDCAKQVELCDEVEQEGKLRVANVEARLIVEKDKLAKTEDARSRLEAGRTKLETALKNAQDRINTLEGSQIRLQQQLAEKRLECDNWQESLKTGNERNTKVRQELKEAQTTIQYLQKEIQVAEERVRDEFTLRLESMESANNHLQSQLDDTAKRLDACKEELRNTRSELNDLKESPVQQENLQLRQSLRAAEEERERLARDAEKNREELERISRRAELLGKEAKALRDCNGDEIDTLREQMDEYQ